MAVTSYDSQSLTAAQQQQLATYTQQWESAKAAGNVAGMNEAHSAAEALRNSAGYTSDLSGNFTGYLGNSPVSDVLNEPVPALSSLVDQGREVIDYNNAVAQANAHAQWSFNAAEAQKSRDWQEYMSNSAHQREVRDLLSAGLNPILSAMGGSGAAVTSGAAASGSAPSNDTGLSSLFANYLTSLIQSATAINNSNVSAKANLASASLISGATRYSADQSYKSHLQGISDQFENEKYLRKWFPQTLPGYGGALSAHLVDLLEAIFN